MGSRAAQCSCGNARTDPGCGSAPSSPRPRLSGTAASQAFGMVQAAGKVQGPIRLPCPGEAARHLRQHPSPIPGVQGVGKVQGPIRIGPDTPFSSTGPISVKAMGPPLRRVDDLLADQHLAGPGVLADSRPQVHGPAEVVTILEHHRPGVDPHVRRGRPWRPTPSTSSRAASTAAPGARKQNITPSPSHFTASRAPGPTAGPGWPAAPPPPPRPGPPAARSAACIR